MQPETKRLLDLVAWARGLGACIRCAYRIALIAVERESGRTFEADVVCLKSSRTKDGIRTDCDSMVRPAWAARPKKE